MTCPAASPRDPIGDIQSDVRDDSESPSGPRRTRAAC